MPLTYLRFSCRLQLTMFGDLLSGSPAHLHWIAVILKLVRNVNQIGAIFNSFISKPRKHFSGLICDCLNRSHNCNDHIFISFVWTYCCCCCCCCCRSSFVLACEVELSSTSQANRPLSAMKIIYVNIICGDLRHYVWRNNSIFPPIPYFQNGGGKCHMQGCGNSANKVWYWPWFLRPWSIRELKQPQQRRQQKPHKFAYLTMKTVFLHALHVHFSSFDSSKTYSFFLRREMTCFAVVRTAWAYDNKSSVLSSYVPSPGSNLIAG